MRFSATSPLLAAAAVCAGSLLAASCAPWPALPSWSHPGSDANRSSVIASPWTEDWTVSAPVTAALPSGLAAGTRLLLGDVANGPEPEVVLSAPGSLLVYDLRGRRVAERSWGEPRLAGLLWDYDRDGKEDVILGSGDAARPAISVCNGCGSLVFEHRLPDSSQGYRSLDPLFVEAGRLYALARPSWPDSPRGLVCFAVPGLSELWDFAIPADPLGVAVQRPVAGATVLTFSTLAVAQGVYLELGPSGDRGQGSDSDIRLYRAGADGRLLDELPVTEGGRPMTGGGLFLPLGGSPDDGLLMVHGELDGLGNADPVALHVVDPSTRAVTATLRLGGRELAGLRVVPNGARARVVLLAAGGSATPELAILDASLEPLARRELPWTAARLGAVVLPAGGPAEALRLFVLGPTEVLVLDEGLRTVRAIPATAPAQMLLSAGARDGLIVFAGGRLDLFRTRPPEP